MFLNKLSVVFKITGLAALIFSVISFLAFFWEMPEDGFFTFYAFSPFIILSPFLGSIYCYRKISSNRANKALYAALTFVTIALLALFLPILIGEFFYQLLGRY